MGNAQVAYDGLRLRIIAISAFPASGVLEPRIALFSSIDQHRFVNILCMNAFPDFMKNPANRIVRSNQATPGVEGFVFDGKDGSQMAFWTCSASAMSAEHVHDYDEYMLVVQGCYTLVINEKRIPINPGEEYFIARGVAHSGEVIAGTRTIHAFGGHRADREPQVNER